MVLGVKCPPSYLCFGKSCVTAGVGKYLPSCLCLSCHAKLSQGAEQILCANHPLFCLLLLLILLLLLFISYSNAVFSKLLSLPIVSATRGSRGKGSHFLGV